MVYNEKIIVVFRLSKGREYYYDEYDVKML
jgi:hypothetical protein